jgi:hypothetical protein
MTIREVANSMAVSPSRLYKLARQPWGKDRFPAFKIHGTWFVDHDAMLDWMSRLLDRGQVLSFAGGRVRRRQIARESLKPERRRPRR